MVKFSYFKNLNIYNFITASACVEILAFHLEKNRAHLSRA